MLKPAAFCQERPNIVFVLVDDQRWDFLSYLGHPWIKTPNIDQLASNSMYFDNAFVSTSLCSPSRASIITGQYAHAHQVVDNDTPLPPDLPTFPKELQKAGYQTGFMGKWHMGGENDMPRPGFDYWLSFKGQGPYFDPVFNINGERVAHEGYTTDLLTDYAVKFIEEQSQGDAPFFLYLSHKAIHESFEPAPRHKGRYADLTVPLPPSFTNSEAEQGDKPLWVRRQRKSWHGAERDYGIQDYGSFDRFFQLYSEAMLSVDESVGRITEALKQQGKLENTIIIYFADNGYLMGEHGLIDKRVMYEPSIRVPCFVHWPAVIDQPQHRKELVLNLDLGPTMLELAGVLPPSSMHGHSFANMLKGEGQPWRKAFLYEYFIDPMAVQTPTIFGLRTEQYSYITTEGVWDIWELYDLQKDPEQRNNLLGHIDFGQQYGSFLRHVQRQEPELWPIVQTLDRQLSELVEEAGGKRQATWKRE